MVNKSNAFPGESTTYSSGIDTESPPDLRFIHFNDVYHVEAGSREPVGGIARFQTVCNYYQNDPKFKDQPELLTFFSGDAFNPSLESSVTKGKHMIEPLNNVGTKIACVGNHDLDFGVEQFQYLAGHCNFPWLCANVLDKDLGEEVPLANCRRVVKLVTTDLIKIGVIGVVEREWLATINTLPPNIEYLSAGATVIKLASELRAEGVDIVIVLSHQRQPNDEKLANKLEPGMVDIILGGHDHDYAHSVVKKNGIHILRSGTDFKQLSYVEARRKPKDTGWNFDIVRQDIVSGIPQEPSALSTVEKITAALKPRLEKPIGYTCVPLDGRFTTVRATESNLGNFVCDLLRFHYDTDCCIMAAGTIRGDQVYPPGILRVKDMMNCFPFEDPCVVILCKGSQIVDALENGVYTYPALEGRFPQVSNIEYTFDQSKEPGKRIVSVLIHGNPVQPDQDYKLATRDYMVRGKDGFTSLMLEGEGGTCKSIVSEENGLLLSTIIRQYFMSLKVIGKWKQFGQDMNQHWSRVQTGIRTVPPTPSAGDEQAVSMNGHSSQPSKEEQEYVTETARTSLVDRAQNRDGINHTQSRKYLTTDNEQSNKYLVADEGSDSESDYDESPDPVQARQLSIIRKVMKKWYRLAGLHRKVRMCTDQSEEFSAPWTRGIAPRLEGRIKMIGAAG